MTRQKLTDGDIVKKYTDLVREYFPGVTDAEADYILWEVAAFPMVRGERELREQLKAFKEYKRGEGI